MPEATNEHEGTNPSPQIAAKPAAAARQTHSPVGLSPRSWPIPRRQWLLGAAGVLVLVVACVFGIPRIELALDTVSADDAYVNGHVTFVAPRVGGQISRVFVEDNNRVHKGKILARLDKEPYEVAVSQKEAQVDTAIADLQAATAAARSIEAEARARRWALQRAIENVDNQRSSTGRNSTGSTTVPFLKYSHKS